MPPLTIALAVVFSVGAACGRASRAGADHAAGSRAVSILERGQTINAETPRTAESLRTNGEQAKDFATRLNRVWSTGNHFKRARMIAAIADDLDAAEVSAALDSLARAGGFSFGNERDDIAGQLFACWSERFPRRSKIVCSSPQKPGSPCREEQPAYEE